MRFIDLAAHGGCSKKAPAKEVRDLLSGVQCAYSGSHLELISRNLPDCGSYPIGGQTLLSTIDIVLPMTLSPADFGEIVVCHVLNDLYASGGFPLFALCILGIPGGMSAASDVVVRVMASAVEQLTREGVSLVGGHTMTDQEDFYLGFAAVGSPIGTKPFIQGEAAVGDVLILTKALGTSIATGRWKLQQATEFEHADVIAGMKQANREAARILSKYPVHACTDISGYGFLGHLYNILYASDAAARIEISKVPRYGSLAAILNPAQSRQAEHNKDYVGPHLTILAQIDPLLEALLFDSQVSGGLLVSVPSKESYQISEELRHKGFSASIVGEICNGIPGAITLID